MTLFDVPNYVYYSGDGGTTSFPFPYKFFEDDEIDVYSITPTATTLLTAGYSISKTGSAPYDSCNVVMAAAPAAGTTLYIERICEISQETDLPTGGAFLESVIEGALDRLTMIAQQLDRDIGRGIKIPVALATSGTDLDFPSPLANALIGWNAAGTSLENKTVASIGALVTTSFTETFMSSVTDQAGMRLYSGTSTAAEVIAAVPSSSRWEDLTAGVDFSTTAAGTSTITMLTDQTSNITPGMAIKYTLSGGVQYAICNSIAAGLMTISGAPLTTGAGALTALSYSPHLGQVIQMPILVPGYFADAGDPTLLLNDNFQQLRWNQSRSYLVQMAATQKVADTGVENSINASLSGVSVFTPLTLSGTPGVWVNSGVTGTSTAYVADYGDAIEISVNKLGNGDANDLSVILTFVGE
jgi:hypothetical protein